MEDDFLKEIAPEDITVPHNLLKNGLNQKLWNKNQKLHTHVRATLLKIVAYFEESLGISVNIQDTIITGSMANFNWTRHSDIDIHLMVDFNDFPNNVDLISGFFNAKKFIWNQQHSLKIYGHDVEVYVQDTNEEHYSTGLYSIVKDDWVVKPTRKNFHIDKATVKKKIADVINQIEDLDESGKPEETYDRALTLKDRIKKMRQAGLETGGEFSSENLAFKYLRNNNYITHLIGIIVNNFDKILSI